MTAESLKSLPLYRDQDKVSARIIGPINQQTILGFQQRLEGVLCDRCFTLTLDLGAAEYLDSDGIRWLQRLQARLQDTHGELRLAVRQGSRIERTLLLLQLDRTFPIDSYPVESDHSGASDPSRFTRV